MMFVLHHLNDILELLMEPGKETCGTTFCGFYSLHCTLLFYYT